MKEKIIAVAVSLLAASLLSGCLADGVGDLDTAEKNMQYRCNVVF